MTIIDTPEGIAALRALTVLSGLRLEARTGMKLTRGPSCLTIARRDYGVKARTKDAALAEFTAILTEKGILS